MSNQVPMPPAELAASGVQLWNSVVSDFELDTWELQLLRQAARISDVLDRLSAEAANAPLTVIGQRGDRISNPLLVESRQQSIVLARILAALRLPTGDEEGRPQRRTGFRGVHQPRKYGNANPSVRSVG